MSNKEIRADGPLVVCANSMADRRRGWIEERTSQLANTQKGLAEKRANQPRDDSEEDKDLRKEEERYAGESERLQKRVAEIRTLG